MKEGRDSRSFELKHESRVDLAVGLLCVLGGLLTMWGGAYMTEGQGDAYVLIGGWVYWVLGGALVVAGSYLIKKRNA